MIAALIAIGLMAEVLLLLTWWLERPVKTEPVEDTSRGTGQW